MTFARYVAPICIALVMSASSAQADDASDYNNDAIPLRQKMEACLHVIKRANGGTPNDVSPGTTNVVGYFSGCLQGKRYQLANGRLMECHTTYTYTETAPKVEIISDVRVKINGEECAVVIY